MIKPCYAFSPLTISTQRAQGFAVTSEDIHDHCTDVASAIMYFKDLDSVTITGEQVAQFFIALISEGRFPTDAADDAKLPEYPDWLL